ncbi:MAG: patatin-like phospholipase family protein [Eubacteriales bacterium]|jgi:predicted patatin/cPLA2 family phospholipase
MKTGLVLEGGGLRGIFTIGALDAMLDERLQVDYCIGVSAGACNGVSYISGQRGRNKRIDIEYIRDPRYLSLRNFVRTGSLFGMEFLFEEVPQHLVPFDEEAFFANPCEMVTVVTDVRTGRPAYFDKECLRGDTTVLRASSSLPALSPPVFYRGRYYSDGGTSDSIPVARALEDGCDRVVVILTRHREYVKSPAGNEWMLKVALRKYPQLLSALRRRHQMYAKEQQLVRQLEQEGRAIVIAPLEPLGLSRFEKNTKKLETGYQLGYYGLLQKREELREFLKK